MRLLNNFLFKGLFFIGLLFMLPRDSWTSKEKHRIFLDNSTFKFSKNLSKKQRLAAGLPPNTYNERVYELTMNPRLGYPTSEKLIAVQNNLKEIRKKAKAGELTARAPGETASNSWQSVGPNNAGGRTRAALFDLSDTDFDKVFAGGVSGGLWVNQDIDNASEVSWSRVNGVPGNLAVTTIVQDKNEPTLLFAGTGESYTTGDAIGNGIYRSTDGGQNWSMVFGTGTSSASTTSSTSGSPPNTTFWVNGNFYVNDMQFWDPTPANTANDDEIIFAALGFAYNSNFDGPNTSTYMGYNSHGLYKSTDKGLNWTRFNTLYSTTGTGYLDAINDIEVASDNTIWISTTNDVYGSESGRFYSSSDGTNFTLHNPSFPSISNKSNIRRVEIEPSGQNSGTFYILINYNNQADIYKTIDGFSTLTQLSEPADEQPADIAAGDFTRGQAFYDLEVEVDPTNDNIVYVGGINWFKSTDGGNNWNQMSDWNGQPSRPYSRTHADQHGLYFRPNSSFNQAVVVNDGGVAFVSNLASATTNDVFTTQEKDFITTQFYSVAQTPEGFASDFIIGGTQDNGTHKIDSPTNAPTNSTEISGGDGGYAYVDQVSSTYYISNYIYNNILYRFDINTNTSSFLHYSNSGDSDYNEGDFINPGALDSNLDILYTNGTKNGTVKIKRFKDLDNSSPPSPDYVPSLATLDASPSAFEVSPFTTTSTLLLVGLDSGKLVKIENAQGSSPSASDLTNNLGSISDIQFGTDENKIFLTYYNYGVNNVYYS
ncbi:MAG: WD40/YVTN/BNR-like repeat-containing protein, partial [Flavobacteriaceae bacterium]